MRWTQDEYEKFLADSDSHVSAEPVKKRKKESKYKNKWTEVDGIKFQSEKEANRYGELKLLKREGSVLNFIRQVHFHLPGGVDYVLDFMVWWRALPMGGAPRITYEDVKGFRIDSFIMKKKMVEDLYPIKIEEK